MRIDFRHFAVDFGPDFYRGRGYSLLIGMVHRPRYDPRAIELRFRATVEISIDRPWPFVRIWCRFCPAWAEEPSVRSAWGNW